VGKEARFKMGKQGIETVKDGSATTRVGRDIDSWASLVGFSHKAVAELFDESEIPLVVQAANETGTRCRVASGVDGTRKLLVARLRRRLTKSEGYLPDLYLEYIEESEQRRAENILEAGGAAIALAYKDEKTGLSDFWQRYNGLKKAKEKQSNPDSVDSESSKNPEDEA
jgi:hypothetical protein